MIEYSSILIVLKTSRNLKEEFINLITKNLFFFHIGLKKNWQILCDSSPRFDVHETSFYLIQ